VVVSVSGVPRTASAPSLRDRAVASVAPRSLSFPKKRGVWVACGNTRLLRVRLGDFSGWAGIKLKNTREVNGLVGKFGDHEVGREIPLRTRKIPDK
jgi:hypothetical protein